MSVSTDEIERLKEIKDELKELVGEAEGLVRHLGRGMSFERARSYWIPHLRMAIDKDHDFLGGSMYTMEDTIREIVGSHDEGDEE